MFDLAPPTRYRLANAPLAQAFAQVKFPVRAKLQTLEGIAPVQDDLDAFFPFMRAEQIQQVMFSFGPGSSEAPPVEGTASKVWRFSDDGGWTLSLSVDDATLGVGSQYGSVGEITERFRAVLQALGTHGGVQRCNRLGVRYINLARIGTSDEESWHTWFRPELIGWVGSGVLAAERTTLLASINQTQLATRPIEELSGPPVDIQGVIRNGYLPPNTIVPGLSEPTQEPAYLIDLDLFVEAPQPLDVQELSSQFGALHGQIDRFFRWCLTPAGEEHFGLETVE